MEEQKFSNTAPPQRTRQISGTGTINLLELAEYIWNRIFVVLLFALAGGMIAFVYTTFFVTPQYSSSVMIYVNNSSVSTEDTTESINGGDLSTSRSLVQTYIVILKSRGTLEKIIEEAGVSYTCSQLSGMISASAVDNTEVFSVTVTSGDPQEAADIANAVLKVLPDRIKAVIDGSNAVKVDEAIPNMTPVSPNVTNKTAFGAMLGLLISVSFYILMFLVDTEIHSENYLLKAYPDVPLLAVVPNMESGGHGYGYKSACGYGKGASSKKKAGK